MRSVPERRIAPGLLVRSAFYHPDAAPLVHALKYGGIVQAATLLAEPMAVLIGDIDGPIVPVPRTLARRWRYGIDPAVELARSIGRITDRRVLEPLSAPVWSRRRAGQQRDDRHSVSFRTSMSVEQAVLVDDVVTTGGTLIAAARALRGSRIRAITATTA